MIPITFPKNLLKEREFVLIPRKQLEELLHLAKKLGREIRLTPFQKRALDLARENRKKGSLLSLHELKRLVGN